MAELFHETDYKLLDRIIADNSLLPLLNNKKWVKLLDLLLDNISEIKECRVKLLWEPENQLRRLLIDEYTCYNFDYYHAAMEAMLSGKPRGWYAYREVEWLDFPRIAVAEEDGKPALVATQNLELIRELLAKTEFFQMVLETDNLRIYAYLPAAKA